MIIYVPINLEDSKLTVEENREIAEALIRKKTIRKQIKKCCDGEIETVEGFIWEKKLT